MNLYHAFSIGFNWYYLVAPAFAVAAFLIGWAIPKVKKSKYGKYEICHYVNERFGTAVATPLALIFGLMLYNESGDGIIQLFDNGLRGYEDGVLSLFFAGCAIVFVALLALVLYRAAFCFGRNTKIKQLCHTYHVQWHPKTPR